MSELNWTNLIPAAVFLIAFSVTWLLYRHFAKIADGSEGDEE
ncbi:MAG: hypothetical protein R3282_01035 [Rhodothermales bacterium]|nr:hypothetical protein [Rhodothermales bacterium]